MTGDSENSNFAEINTCNLIVTTPEKWDSLTRKWKGHKHMMFLIGLFLMDEVHMLNENRGATLEVVVSRMKTSVKIGCETFRDGAQSPNVRFVAISATVPNIDDISKWLSDHNNEPAVMKCFGNEYRPVQLVKKVLTFPNNNSSSFQFDSSLNDKLMEIIYNYSDGKPTLIFCNTRKSAVAASELLYKQSLRRPLITTKEKSFLSTKHFKEKKLVDIFSSGIAFHHAGLHYQDRLQVEQSFLNGSLKVICTTSTVMFNI
jgi:ATP-dependent DNA helicase HFM1/MER3